MLDCLTNIIGVTQTDCQCVIGNATPEQITQMRTSTSGVYMDDVPGSPSLSEAKIVSDCANMAKWAIDAIPAAAKLIEADILAGITNASERTKNTYKGTVGQQAYAGTLKVTQPYQFIRIDGHRDSDAVMQVQSGKVYVNKAGVFNYYIIKQVEAAGSVEQISTGTFLASKAGPTQVAFNLQETELPFAVDGNPITYYFVWDRTGINNEQAAPYDNANDCGCSAGPGYNEYMTVSGGEAVSLDSVAGIARRDAKSHGFMLNVRVSCKASNIICRNMEDNEAIKLVIAWSIAYRANAILIQKILDSNQINRFTMMSRDALYGKMSNYKAEYTGRLAHLMLVLDMTQSDCFVCKQTKAFKATILS